MTFPKCLGSYGDNYTFYWNANESTVYAVKPTDFVEFEHIRELMGERDQYMYRRELRKAFLLESGTVDMGELGVKPLQTIVYVTPETFYKWGQNYE